MVMYHEKFAIVDFHVHNFSVFQGRIEKYSLQWWLPVHEYLWKLKINQGKNFLHFVVSFSQLDHHYQWYRYYWEKFFVKFFCSFSWLFLYFDSERILKHQKRVQWFDFFLFFMINLHRDLIVCEISKNWTAINLFVRKYSFMFNWILHRFDLTIMSQ